MQKNVLSMTRLGVALCALMALSLSWMVPPAQAQTVVTVASDQALKQALRQGAPGAEGLEIRLAPGTYGPLAMRDATGPLRLVAADAKDPPRIASLFVKDSTDIHFEGVVLDYTFDPDTTTPWKAAFHFKGVQGLSFDRVVVDGDLMRGTGTDGDGYAVAKGLVIVESRDITVRNSEIRDFHVGINFRRSRNITLQDSHLHGIRKDHVTLIQVQDVDILGNRFDGHHRSFAFDDHPDMVQMWTKDTDQPSARVTLRGNLFNSGQNPYSQTVFIRNDRVDKGLAGPELYFRDLVIEDNVIINAHLHGIAVGETDGLIIRNNTLIRNPVSEKPGMSDELASPRIRVAEASRNVLIENNAAYRIPSPAHRSWVVRNNLEIQRHAPNGTGYYKGLFADALTGDPADLASFHYLPRSPLHQRGIGAPMLDVQP